PKPTILYSNYRFVLELYLPLPKNMDWPAAMANKCLGFCLAFEDWWCQYEAYERHASTIKKEVKQRAPPGFNR
ncbi:unnamed protein product, partial [Durusdinium trenchii]